eukprot:PhF_6_TR37445/c0_g1_i1/m.55033
MDHLMEASPEEIELLQTYVSWFPSIMRFKDDALENQFIQYLIETVNTKRRSAFNLVSMFVVFICSYIITLANRPSSAENYVVNNHCFWYLVYFVIASSIYLFLPGSRQSMYETIFTLHLVVAVILYGFWNSGEMENRQAQFLPIMTLVYCGYTLAVFPRVTLSVCFGMALVLASIIWCFTVSHDVANAFILIGINLFQVAVLLMFSGHIDKSFRIAFARSATAMKHENLLKDQKSVTEALLKNILPVTIVERLNEGKQHIRCLYDRFKLAAVLFADIKNFTSWSSSLDPYRVGTILHRLMSLLDNRCYELGCEKVKTVGDAYWVVVGVPDIIPLEDMCYRISEFALAMPRIMSKVNAVYGTALAQRIGVHVGPITAGIIGMSKFSYDVWGTTMDRCIDLEAGGVPNQVHVSEEFRAFLEETTNCKLMYRLTPSGLGTDEDPTYFLVDDIPEEDRRETNPEIELPRTSGNKEQLQKPHNQRKIHPSAPMPGGSFAWGDFTVEEEEPKSIITAVLKEEFAWGDFVVQHDAPKPSQQLIDKAIERRAEVNVYNRPTSPSPMSPAGSKVGGARKSEAGTKKYSIRNSFRARPSTLLNAEGPKLQGEGSVGDEKNMMSPMAKDKYSAPNVFAFGDFAVTTNGEIMSPMMKGGGISKTLAAFSFDFVFDDFIAKGESKRDDGIIDVESVSQTSTQSLESEKSDTQEPSNHEDEPEKEPKTPVVNPMQLFLLKLIEAGNVNQKKWNMKFVNEEQEASFQQSRKVQPHEVFLAIASGWCSTMVIMFVWLIFQYDTASSGASIAIYTLTGVQTILCVTRMAGITPATHLPLALNCIVVTAMYFIALAGHTSSDRTLDAILTSLFFMVLLAVMQFGRRLPKEIGIACCLGVSIIELVLDLSFGGTKGSDTITIFLDQVISLIACFVFILREKSDRSAFVLILTSLQDELNLQEEKKARDVLLDNVLPASVAKQLKSNSQAFIFERMEAVTVIFLDVLHFNDVSNAMEFEDENDMALCKVLNHLFTAYDHLCKAARVEKIKSIGGVYLAVVGAPEARPDHVVTALSVAFNMLRIGDALLSRHPELSIRIGIHTGPLVGGVLGTRKLAYDVFGDTVNTSSRLMSSAGPRTIHISTQVYEQCPYTVLERFDWQGTTLQLKGKGTVPAYSLVNLKRRTKESRHEFRATYKMRDGEDPTKS